MTRPDKDDVELVKPIYRSTHSRSEESNRKRNRAHRKKKKLLKQMLCQQRKENLISDQKKLLELTQRNRFLTRCIAGLKGKIQNSKGYRNCKNYQSLSKSIAKHHATKSALIVRHLRRNIAEFKKNDIVICDKVIGEGVFGKVAKAFILSMNQRVAIKILKAGATDSEILAEASVASVMNGHLNFPFLFGIVPGYCMLMEHIGSLELSAPTMRFLLLNNELSQNAWRKILQDISRAVNDLHSNGILHNDLHANNILIKNKTLPKIIDFGKACLTSNPVIYNIEIGSARHHKFNSIHRHLAYELRNVPGSAVCEATDVYTLGYDFHQVAKEMVDNPLKYLSKKMLAKCKQDRPSLLEAILEFNTF